MSHRRVTGIWLAVHTCLAILLGAQPALACSVCFGDPNSAMAQGVQAGALVLLGVVGTVLLGLASLLLFWMRRAANLSKEVIAVRASAILDERRA